MDQLLAALAGAAPQLGIGGVLLFLLVLSQRQTGAERTEHAAELTALRTELKAQQQRNDTLQKSYDQERDKRRRAEDQLAAAHRESR